MIYTELFAKSMYKSRAGHSGSEGTDSLRKESDQKLATL